MVSLDQLWAHPSIVQPTASPLLKVSSTARPLSAVSIGVAPALTLEHARISVKMRRPSFRKNRRYGLPQGRQNVTCRTPSFCILFARAYPPAVALYHDSRSTSAASYQVQLESRVHMVTESQFQSWTAPSSDSEQDRQARTVRMIRDAMREHEAFAGTSYSVYAKGSYPNNTNVRVESDVDVAVQCREVFYHDGPKPGPPSPYSGKWTPQFLRSSVTDALVSKFGQNAVSPGNTAIQLNASSARVDADVVPCFDYRCYFDDGTFREGVRIVRTDGGTVNNYPQQHLERGIEKNAATNRRYKSAVRILKRVAGFMEENGAHRHTPSYLIESLVYNCPHSHFVEADWEGRTKLILSQIYSYASVAEPSDGSVRWTEADGCKFLFHTGQKWVRLDAQEFALAAWSYLDFG